MNTHMTMKSGTLYLYGGILEQGDRSYVLNDLWSLDIKKMNAWKRINRTDKVDWEGSDKGKASVLCSVINNLSCHPLRL